jgi:hypothetical protein
LDKEELVLLLFSIFRIQYEKKKGNMKYITRGSQMTYDLLLPQGKKSNNSEYATKRKMQIPKAISRKTI